MAVGHTQAGAVLEAGSTGEAFLAFCRENLQEADRLRSRLKEGNASSEVATLDLYNRMEECLQDVQEFASLAQSVHPVKEVRKAGETAEQEAVALSSEIGLDHELYAVLAALDSTAAELDADARRTLEKSLRDFKRAGVDRDEATRRKVRELNERITKLGQTFSRNIREDSRTIELADAAELAGMPDDFISAHKPGDDGRIRISTDHADFIPIMSYAENDALREGLFRERSNIGYPANGEVLEALIAARNELAQTLGYPSYAAYATEELMIQDTAKARTFIERVAELAAPAGGRDLAILLDRKRAGDTGAEAVMPWESAYLTRLEKAERFNYNPAEARRYFDVEKVTAGILDLSADLFGVAFELEAEAPRWHEDVRVYAVSENGEAIGRIYLDLHPRDNKFKHAAMFSMTAYNDRLPEGAIVTNFPDPKKSEGPALMEHSEVTTYFHEFGHLLHFIFSGRQKWVRLGMVAEWDFVEVPSQLFEEWAWDAQVLQRFATDPDGAVIPADLVERMRDAKDFGRGIHSRQQMYYAMLALTLYTDDPATLDLRAVVDGLQAQYSPFPVIEDTHFECGFGHLYGYSSNYYTYMWSLVIAMDLFANIRERGMADRAVALNYRRKVLEPGGAKDGAQLVRDFLGRDFSFEAFEEWLS